MAYFGDIQDAAAREKLRMFVAAVAEKACDDDEAIDGRGREPDKLDYQDGFTWSAPAWLSFYSSTGTGTPWQDKLIERLIDSQAREWAEQYPNRAGMLDILSADDDGEGEFRSEAEEWETAALEDEAIYIRFEAHRESGDIVIRACFCDEINAPYGKEFEERIDEAEFMAMDSDALEALGNRVAEAPYSITLD